MASVEKNVPRDGSSLVLRPLDHAKLKARGDCTLRGHSSWTAARVRASALADGGIGTRSCAAPTRRNDACCLHSVRRAVAKRKVAGSTPAEGTVHAHRPRAGSHARRGQGTLPPLNASGTTGRSTGMISPPRARLARVKDDGRGRDGHAPVSDLAPRKELVQRSRDLRLWI